MLPCQPFHYSKFYFYYLSECVESNLTSVLKAHDVVEEPGLVIEQVRPAWPSRQWRGSGGCWEPRTGARALRCIVSLCSRARHVPDSPEAPPWGPPMWTGGHLPPGPAWGPWDRTGLGWPCDEKLALGFLRSCSIRLPQSPHQQLVAYCCFMRRADTKAVHVTLQLRFPCW